MEDGGLLLDYWGGVAPSVELLVEDGGFCWIIGEGWPLLLNCWWRMGASVGLLGVRNFC